MSYTWGTAPLDHQEEDWLVSRDLRAYGVLWEMGLGKSKLLIDTACWLYLTGQITALLVVAPNGVHRNMVTDELPKHAPKEVDWKGVVYYSSKAGTKAQDRACHAVLNFPGLAVVAISYDALVTEGGRDFVRDLVTKRPTLGALDESTRIKTPSSLRSKLATGLADLLAYRRIMTGTPAANGPFDLYAQIKFLDDQFWVRAGIPNYHAFQHRFGIMKRFTPDPSKGQTFRPFTKCVAYKNLDELNRLLAPITTRRIKDDHLNLPKKMYTRRYFEMTSKQRLHYERLKLLFMTELDNGELITGALAMVRILRLHQVTSGYLPSEEEERAVPIFGGKEKNPRLELLRDVVEDVPHQAIIWARFTEDVNQIMAQLNADPGNPRAVRYDGPTKQRDREEALRLFHAGERQFFVANPAAISMGVTLVEAKTVIYYNNDFSLEKRLQSEDRAHRIGQDRPVLYIDLIAEGTADEHIVQALQNKYSIAAEIQGDRLREWL